MRYFAALLAAAAVASAATGSLSTYMPECAVPCLTTAISDATTCKGADDLECFCITENYHAIYDSGVACVLQACGNDVSLSEVLPAAARMCEDVLAANNQPVTSGGNPAPTTTAEDPAATTTTETAESASTSTNAADARLSAHVIGVVAPLFLAVAANL